MTVSRYFWPLLILVAGGVLLFWQHRLLNEARAISAARNASVRAIEAASPGSAIPIASSDNPLWTTGSSEREASPPVDLAVLTSGLEYSPDWRVNTELLDTVADALAALSPRQAQAVFGEVTRQLATVPPAELSGGAISDPAHTRAILLLTPLMARLPREAPDLLLKWMVDPALPSFFRQNGGPLAEEAVRSFALLDPERAMRWLEEHGSSLPESWRAWPAALGALAASDLPHALREASERGVLAETLQASVPALSTAEARRMWSDAVLTLDDPARRSPRWSALIEAQNRSDGWQAAFDVAEFELPAEARSAAVLQPLVDAGLDEAPAELVVRLTRLAPETGGSLVVDVVGRWAERDYNAAAVWLGNVPADAPWRDAAVNAFVGKIRKLDPDAARIWTATIKDPSLRGPTQAP